ncbi:MAG TPA: hypothetical protein PKK82_05780 [Anaerolineaceae bacterium]|nr:hypothetical protein [Anaerolineaceae bacterium]
MHLSSAPLVIGIAGPSGSGKTTLAHGILERIGAEKPLFCRTTLIIATRMK